MASAVVLRSGKDAYQTALAIVKVSENGLAQTHEFRRIVSSWFLDTSRAFAQAMHEGQGYLDGSLVRRGLIQGRVENATVLWLLRQVLESSMSMK